MRSFLSLRFIDKTIFEDRTLFAQRTYADKDHVQGLGDGRDIAIQAARARHTVLFMRLGIAWCRPLIVFTLDFRRQQQRDIIVIIALTLFVHCADERDTMGIMTVEINTFDGFFSISPERTPHNDPNVRGLFWGLTHASQRALMGYAVLEGVGFGMADGLRALQASGTHIERCTIGVVMAYTLLYLLGSILCPFIRVEQPGFTRQEAYGIHDS